MTYGSRPEWGFLTDLIILHFEDLEDDGKGSSGPGDDWFISDALDSSLAKELLFIYRVTVICD